MSANSTGPINCGDVETKTEWLLGLGLENKSPQIELLRSEPSSSHHIVTIYSSIAHKIKSWICGIGLKDFGRQDQKLIQMQIVP